MKTKTVKFHENRLLINSWLDKSILFAPHAYCNVHSLTTISVKFNLN